LLYFAYINDFYLFFLEGFASFAGLTRFFNFINKQNGALGHSPVAENKYDVRPENEPELPAMESFDNAMRKIPVGENISDLIKVFLKE
jgi:hypothetical protein